jgi:CheY-like chemotaxis protein
VTATDKARTSSSAPAAHRSDFELAVDQVLGIAGWTQAHRAPDEVRSRISREGRLDLALRRDVVARQRQAMQGWTERQLRDNCTPAYAVAPARAVLALRHPWFSAKVAEALRAGGVAVVADLDNGADAVGIVIAEQPDLLLVEDRLPLVPGAEVCMDVTRWAPRTMVAMQVAEDRGIGACLDAGAALAFTRRMPPGDVASHLLEALDR